MTPNFSRDDGAHNVGTPPARRLAPARRQRGMGSIDFTGLITLGVAIGVVVAALLAALGYGAWWLWSHLQWVS